MAISARSRLERAYKILKNPDRWCQKAYALTMNGIPTMPWRDDAIQWCAAGAVDFVKNEKDMDIISRFEAEDLLNRAAEKLYGISKITTVNDKLGYDAVMKCYEEVLGVS